MFMLQDSGEVSKHLKAFLNVQIKAIAPSYCGIPKYIRILTVVY